MMVESPVAGWRPADRISVMRPFSIATAALGMGLGLTQSISVALVSIVRVFTCLSSSLGLDARVLRHLQPAARFGFDKCAEFGGTVADGLDAAVVKSLHYVGRAQYRGDFFVKTLDHRGGRARRRQYAE